MSIDEMIRNGGTLTIESYFEKGKNGYKTSFVKMVEDEHGDSEYREVGTLFTNSVRKALKYMPDLIERYSERNGYKGFEIDLRNPEDKENSVLVDFSTLMREGYSVCVSKGFLRDDCIETTIHGRDGYIGKIKADSVENSLAQSADFVRECEEDFANSNALATFDESFVM